MAIPDLGSASPPGSAWDHSSHEEFFKYYADESQDEAALQRLRTTRDSILRILDERRGSATTLEVADIGCGAGAMCQLWAGLGHRVHGLDVNQPLLELARERARSAGLEIDFRIGSATKLPWDDGSMDVCMALELLEHVSDWKACLREFERVLRPGGLLYLSTTNKLCPKQQEFNLALYSWYPGRLKRHFERLALTERPDLANFAKYPAVNWFTFFNLQSELAPRGFLCLDRFAIMDLSTMGTVKKAVGASIRALPPLRWLAHVATPGTWLMAIKEG